VESGSPHLPLALSPLLSQPLPHPCPSPRVRDRCIASGAGWAGSPAAAAGVPEREYYAALLDAYAAAGRLYPYHLAHATARAARTPPAPFYRTTLIFALASDAPYDGALPNFTAADVAAVLGVDRNAYIALAQAVKARAGGGGGGGGGGGATPGTPAAGSQASAARAAAARELVPAAPLPLVVVDEAGGEGEGGAEAGGTPPGMPRTVTLARPWWRAHAVNVTESEFRGLSPAEVGAARSAAAAGGAPLGALDAGAAAALHARGLLYLSIPVGPGDVVATTSLEGFVSNQDRGGPAGGADPLEPLLYALLLVAGGPGGDSVARLAGVLGVDAPRLAAAAGVAARLGFVRVTPAAATAAGPSDHPPPPRSIALVVDAAVTSLLMVGHPMSPGLKKHAVTLFEGGRLSGGAALADLQGELEASAAAAGGEMAGLARAATALAAALACVVEGARAGGEGVAVEVVRKEALAALGAGPSARLLSSAFAATVSVWPCPPPPVALGAGGALPAHFGPTAAAQTPWAPLALWTGLGAGPPGALVLPAGTLLRRLPSPRLRAAAAVLVWVWAGTGAGPPARPKGGRDGGPVLLGGTLLPGGPPLLPALNEALARCGALLVAPIAGGALGPGPGPDGAPPLPPDAAPAALAAGGGVVAADVPLPLDPAGLAARAPLAAFDAASGAPVSIPPPPGLTPAAAAALGLDAAVGTLRFLRVRCGGGGGGGGGCGGEGEGGEGRDPPPSAWAPLGLALGLPLSAPPPVMAAVCEGAKRAAFLSLKGIAAQAAGAAGMQATIGRLVAAHGRGGQGGGGGASGAAAFAAAAATRHPLTEPPMHALAWSGRDGALRRAGGDVAAAAQGAACVEP